MAGMTHWLALTLLGAGAMNSPRYPPAGLLVRYRRRRVMLDGGPGSEPNGPIDAWLVTDEHAELIRPLRRLAAGRNAAPSVDRVVIDGLDVEPHPVEHTSHPTFGYLIRAGAATAAWAPEFWSFPDWVADVDLLFAEAAGWRVPIRFARGVGGHMAASDVAEQARRRGVRRLVLAHIGRPSLRAIDAGELPPFGEWGMPGRTYRLPARRSR
jgi:Beta-lactamase superfamily domain